MTSLALVLVFTSAVMHATWNLLAKQAGGGILFVWMFTTLSTVIYVPVVLVVVFVQQPFLTLLHLPFILGSIALQLIYFLLLTKGYRTGDLSLVYPLARGTGPLLASVAAIAFLGERPTGIALVGILLIAVGIFLLAGNWRKLCDLGTRKAVMYALLTGVVIAAYTIWDKNLVSTLLLSPLLLQWANDLGRALFLTPFALRRWDEVRTQWRSHRIRVLGVAVLAPLSYTLVLSALVFSPVSYVAPTRAVSILFGTIMGARLLTEGDTLRRLLAACVVVLGIVALTLG